MTYDVFVTLRFEPLADTKLVLDGTQQTGLLLRNVAAAVEDGEDLEGSLACVDMH